MWSSDGGTGVGKCDTCGCSEKNFSVWFLDSISASWLVTPAMCSAARSIS